MVLKFTDIRELDEEEKKEISKKITDIEAATDDLLSILFYTEDIPVNKILHDELVKMKNKVRSFNILIESGTLKIYKEVKEK